MSDFLLGANQIRKLATELDITPTKKLGQNFVIDPNTVRRIIEIAEISSSDIVVEIGPGLGSLTLGLLAAAQEVIAIEIDARLAEQLPKTVAEFAEPLKSKLSVINQDALRVTELPKAPAKLVANLPYNISVPVLLHFLEQFPSITQVLVMVQAEVGERLAAKPGSRIYGVPSVKAQFYAHAKVAAQISRQIFWPVPNVDSVLVSLTRRTESLDPEIRTQLFAIVDSAFGQRRKTLRSSLVGYFGDTERVEQTLAKAGIDPKLRGEQLSLEEFMRIAQSAKEVK